MVAGAARGQRVLFMVVERFSPESARDIYRRVRREGRLLPDGLRYVDSWVRAASSADSAAPSLQRLLQT